MHVHSVSLSTALLLLGSSVAYGQVALDGTLGPKKTLAGPDYRISADLGQQVGGNLFHSFESFSLATGESALFTGPDSVEHIISRVTGGEKSFIDGLIHSSMQNADLYLFNPSGIALGQHTTLDIDGSFYASTADYLSLNGEGRFDARSTKNSLLTSAPPSAFGFLTESPAAISVSGSILKIPNGEDFSLIGGDLKIEKATIFAPQGQLKFISTSAAEEMLINLYQPKPNDLDQGSDISITQSKLDTNGTIAGGIYIFGGDVSVDSATVTAVTRTGDGDPIHINAEHLMLSNDAQIISKTQEQGRAGALQIETQTLKILNGSVIASSTYGSGQAGSLTVNTKELQILGMGADRPTGLSNNAKPGSSGNANDIFVQAQEVYISRDDATKLTGIGSRTLAGAKGNAGAIYVSTEKLRVHNGANIASSTHGKGDAGIVNVVADSILIDGANFIDNQNKTITAIASTAQPGATGSASDVNIIARSIDLRGAGGIASTTFSDGDAATVRIAVEDTLFINGDGPYNGTGITSNSEEGATGNAGKIVITAQHLIIDGNSRDGFSGIGSVADPKSQGRAGDITINAQSIELRKGGVISSSSLGIGKAGSITINTQDLKISGTGSFVLYPIGELIPSSISSSSEAEFSDSGGMITVQADNIDITHKGTITTRSLSFQGEAGDVVIKTNDLHLNDGVISTTSTSSGGGNINIQAHKLITIIDGEISTSVAGGDEDAGNIFLEGLTVLALLDDSEIEANTFGGTGGVIRISTDNLFQSSDSKIVAEAESRLGIDGVISIDAPDIDISAELVVLPSEFFDPTEILVQSCAERTDTYFTSLLAKNYQVLPDSPYALRAYLPTKGTTQKLNQQVRNEDTLAILDFPYPKSLGCGKND